MYIFSHVKNHKRGHIFLFIKLVSENTSLLFFRFANKSSLFPYTCFIYYCHEKTHYFTHFYVKIHQFYRFFRVFIQNNTVLQQKWLFLSSHNEIFIILYFWSYFCLHFGLFFGIYFNW